MTLPNGELVIDDRASADLRSNLGPSWRFVADTVMGGVSRGVVVPDVVADRACLCLRGQVSLEFNGGFVQASLDLNADGVMDASAYSGVELDVLGNNETYNVHLRTADTRIVWQSYRASFVASPQWQRVRLPFATFTPHRIAVSLNLHALKRIGLVAIGRAFAAELCVGCVALYVE